MTNGTNPIVKSIWNADDERLKTLVFFITNAELRLMYWDLEEAIKNLHAAKRVASAKLMKYENLWKELITQFNEIEKLRRELYMSQEINERDKKKVELYNKCDEVCMKLNSLCQASGWWFREGLDPSKAALRR